MVHEVEDQLMKDEDPKRHRGAWCMTALLLPAAVLLLSAACSSEESHTAPAVDEKDSLPFMRSYGISSLISDSGVIRYKMIAEEWNIYNTTQPPKWTFIKGLFMEKFDSTFHIEWFIQSDTAYCYNQRLWELRGRVLLRNQKNEVFRTEELFWDMSDHEVYSTQFMRITTPDRELSGYRFRSNEQMTDYMIYDTEGILPVNDMENSNDSIARTPPTKQQ